MADVLRPPAALSEILGCLDPAGDGAGVAIAADLLRPDFPRSGFQEAAGFVDALLTDPFVSNADLKGLLNRETASAWSVELGFDADAKGARECLQAVKAAIFRFAG